MNMSINTIKKIGRILIVTFGGIVGGIPIAGGDSGMFSPIAIPWVSGLLGLSFGIMSELTRKWNGLVKFIARVLGCSLFLFLLFWICWGWDVILDTISVYSGRGRGEGGLITGSMMSILYWYWPIILSVIVGLSFGQGLLNKRNLAVRAIGTTAIATLIIGVVYDIQAYLVSFGQFGYSCHYEGYLLGCLIAGGIALGYAVAEAVIKDKKAIIM